MNRIFIGIMIFATLAQGCKKDASPTNMVNEMVDTSARVTYTGMFENGPFGTTSGSAKIYLQNGKYVLAFENFVTSNGPDLHVYVSREKLPLNFIDLGKIKSTNGNQVYTINSSFSLADYKYALVHCQQFNHLFGSAELK
ncbi:MAG: DM13 domain-containing protein [Ferruginibacter sp.]